MSGAPQWPTRMSALSPKNNALNFRFVVESCRSIATLEWLIEFEADLQYFAEYVRFWDNTVIERFFLNLKAERV